MITAVDTSVLLDVFTADKRFGPASRAFLKRCIREGSLRACDPVWAEVTPFFPSPDKTHETMRRLGVEFSAITLESALRAGTIWKKYRQSGGRRSRVVADFLIGAHALLQADRLLTRDRGFYRKYFTDLQILDPGDS